MTGETESPVWFDWMSWSWYCDECGAQAEPPVDDDPPLLDWHWRPKCGQPMIAAESAEGATQ